MKKSVLIPFERYQYYKSLVNEHNLPPEGKAEPTINDNKHDTVNITEHKNQDKLKPEIILTHLPKRNKSKALSLLNVIEQNPNLDWNNRGEVLLNGAAIPYSHISDILHDALNATRRTEPAGCQEFYSNLGHIPTSLISNPKRRVLIGERKLPIPEKLDRKINPLTDWSGFWKPL